MRKPKLVNEWIRSLSSRVVMQESREALVEKLFTTVYTTLAKVGR